MSEGCRPLKPPPPPNPRPPPPKPPLPRPPPNDEPGERLPLACCCPPVHGLRGLYVGLTRLGGNCPLVGPEVVVVGERLVLDCCPLGVTDAVFLVVVALVGFDGDEVDFDDVDGD